ncbi:MAG TPA: DUF5660 family protein [Patescibacteria group bacterium]|nr:DUF5660 family protein [Patescibacteria group bacterium]
MGNPKLKNKRPVNHESLEAKPQASSEPATLKGEAKAFANDAVNMLWRDLLVGSKDSAVQQLFGGDLSEGQAVSLKKQQAAKAAEEEAVEKKPQVTAEHMEYFRTVNNADRVSESRVEMSIQRSVDEIRIEIQKLIKTSRLVERTVKDATADKAPVKAGKYHISFFEFVLNVIRDATRKLEDTNTMGAVFTSKKQQSKYWNSYKSHGTSFGLSGERSSATQTG